MINMIIVFVVKVIDNLISTGKTILIQRNRAILASLTVIVSNIIFYKLIDAVNSGGAYTIYIVSVARGIGTYLALLIDNKLSKERLFVNIIMNDNREAMTELREFLKEHKITNLTTDAYTKDFKKTLSITAYAETKEQSKLIDNFLKMQDTKFKRIIQIQ